MSVEEEYDESTYSEGDPWTPKERQGMINYYVNELMGRIVERPYESVPELLQYLQTGGPCMNEEEILKLFGGRPILLRTCRRMNIIRRAALQGKVDDLPIALGNWEGGALRAEGTTESEYIDWWAPHLDSPDLFWRNLPGMEDELQRFPSRVDTDDYLATSTEDRSPELTSSESSHGWMQMLLPQDWYGYEADPEQNLPTDSDMDISSDMSVDMEVD